MNQDSVSAWLGHQLKPHAFGPLRDCILLTAFDGPQDDREPHLKLTEYMQRDSDLLMYGRLGMNRYRPGVPL